MPKTVILGTARTPVGRLGGGLSSLKATELGGIAIGGSPADFGKLIADETEKWAKVVRAAHIKAE